MRHPSVTIGDPVKVCKIIHEGGVGVRHREEWWPATVVDVRQYNWIAVAYSDGTREVLPWYTKWSLQ